MDSIVLITANKNYSRWTLPAWLSLKVAGLDFDEITIPFSDPDARNKFDELSPTGSVPVLKHGDLTIWDSVAICEYVAELVPEAGLWAAVPFVAIGEVMPTNVRARTGPINIPEDIQKILDRNTNMWRDCRIKFAEHGPYLFGQFSIADAMSAPLVNRLVTYSVLLGDIEADYRDTMRNHPNMVEYIALAEAETWQHKPSEHPFI